MCPHTYSQTALAYSLTQILLDIICSEHKGKSKVYTESWHSKPMKEQVYAAASVVSHWSKKQMLSGWYSEFSSMQFTWIILPLAWMNDLLKYLSFRCFFNSNVVLLEGNGHIIRDVRWPAQRNVTQACI